MTELLKILAGFAPNSGLSNSPYTIDELVGMAAPFPAKRPHWRGPSHS